MPVIQDAPLARACVGRGADLGNTRRKNTDACGKAEGRGRFKLICIVAPERLAAAVMSRMLKVSVVSFDRWWMRRMRSAVAKILRPDYLRIGELRSHGWMCRWPPLPRRQMPKLQAEIIQKLL